MSKIKNFFKLLWSRIAIPLIIIVVGLIVGLIFGGVIAFYTMFGMVGILVVFSFGRQLYWWITKTGDYQVYDDDND